MNAYGRTLKHIFIEKRTNGALTVIWFIISTHSTLLLPKCKIMTSDNKGNNGKPANKDPGQSCNYPDGGASDAAAWHDVL